MHYKRNYTKVNFNAIHMKTELRKGTIGVLSLAFATFGMSSCVQNKYDLDNLNTEVTIAQDGFAMPLGSTKQIKAKDLLKNAEGDIISSNENGLEISIKDTISLAEQLPDFGNLLKIDDIEIEQNVQFEIGSLDADNMAIDGMEISYDVDAGNFNTDITVPAISKNEEIKLGMWKYASKIKEIDLSSSLQDVNLNTSVQVDLPAIPGGSTITGPLPIPNKTYQVDSKSSNVTINFDSPDETISNIRDIILNDNAQITVTLKLTGHQFIKEGSVNPDINLDLGSLFTITDDNGKNLNGVITLSESLNQGNAYTTSKNVNLKSINLTGTVPQVAAISLKGSLSVSDAKTTVAALQGTDGTIGAELKIGFANVNVKSATFDITGFKVNQTVTIPVSLGEGITLPEHVTSIDKVMFTDASSINLRMQTQNFGGNNLNLTMKKLAIKFPNAMKVKEAAGGTFTQTDKDLTSGYSTSLHIQEIGLPSPVNGRITWSDNIGIEATVEIDGTGINSAKFPTEEANDYAISAVANSSLAISDWTASIESFDKPIDTFTKDIEQIIDGDISEFGTFTITPKGNPAINIGFSIPSTAIDFTPSSGGINIAFPEFIRFKNVSAAYNFNEATNSITIKNSIPDNIRLEIDKLVVSPERLDNGNNVIKGKLTVKGGISINGGTVSKKDIETLANNKISVKASVPSLAAQTIALDEFKIDINEKLLATLIQVDQLPEEIKINELTEAVLDNVAAQFEIALNGLPDLGEGKNLVADIDVTVPKQLVLNQNDNRVKGNTLNISGKFINGKLSIAPVDVLAINLSDYDFKADLKDTIKVDGRISVQNPEIDLSELQSSIEANIQAGLKDIRFSSIKGKIEYKIENNSQVIKLEGLPEFLTDESVSLDLVNPALKLKAVTNMGIPVNGTVSITPVRNGVKEESEKIELDLAIDGSPDAAQKDSVMFYIAPGRSGIPSGYTFVECQSIKSLIRHIPDELEVEFSAETDGNKEAVVVPDANYMFDIQYAFVCPLAFGEDFEFTYTDTLRNIGSDIVNLLKGNTIQLGGEIENQLPLELDLALDLLDSDGKVIAIAGPRPSQTIKSCSAEGEAEVTPLDLTIKIGEKDDLSKFESILVSFRATSGDAAGIQINEESYVQAALKLILPEGINADLKDFGFGQDSQK